MSRLFPSWREAAAAVVMGLLVVSISAPLSPAMAGSIKCPVWTSAMIDSFAADGGLFQSSRNLEPPVVYGTPLDNPKIPAMSCVLFNAYAQLYFGLYLGEVSKLNFRPNQGLLEASGTTGNIINYVHLSWPEGDVGAAHACRAEVLQSFVWNQFCAPALP